MTLNITLLTERAIYQSADFRLINIDTRSIISDTSTKLVTLQYDDWNGFVSYTGIGRWQERDTSEVVMEWLTGLRDATIADVTTKIRDKGTEWLRKIEKAWRRVHHTFILAAFETGGPQLALISNFEDCLGRSDANPRPSLEISTRRLGASPLIMVTGWKPAVSRQARRRLERLVRDICDDPARIRNMLAKLNDEAASSQAAQGMISKECSVVSFRADGQGVGDILGPVEIRSLIRGTPLPGRKDLAKLLGFDPGHLVVGHIFGSSQPPMSYAPCRPHLVVPANSAGYEVREVTHKDFASCRALDVSETGLVLGDGTPPEREGDYFLWTCPTDGELELCGLMATPGGINEAGEVAAEASMSDGTKHAVRWKGGAPIDLGCYRGKDSGATAINATGVIAGWVCIDPVNRGQLNYRPAAWSPEGSRFLEDFRFTWGQAVDVNDAGIVLVVGFDEMQQCWAILWDPLAGTTEVIGSTAGVFPSAIAADGTVLGTANDRDGKSVAWLVRPGQSQWERLGTAPGFYATGMNDAVEVIGRTAQNGYGRPLLRRASGELVWLPYFDHHWCTPLAINRSGVIVGMAQTDHGTHALVWTP